MKKLLLSLSVAFFSYVGIAQVTVYIDPPSANSGNYNNTYADPAGGDWAVPDMTIPANAVTGTLALVSDGTPDDSLGCNPLTNGAAITGKIAVVYRGACEFGAKALNAQNAGAIAVIIVNHTGAPVGMAGGADGINVTIPVVMISEQAGALLHDEIVAGTLSGFIGNKQGFFANDMGLSQKDVLRAKAFSNIQSFSQDATEFKVSPGAWVFNYGSNDQTVVEVTCSIVGGSSPYSNVVLAGSILSGDSAYVSFPDFSQATYANGYYTMTYSITSAATDDFPDDNALNADFMMSDNLFSYARIDPATMTPISVSGYRSNAADNVFSNCIQFSDPNASRMAIKGMTFSASTASSGPASGLDGKLVNVEAYTWDNAVTDLNDANFGVDAYTFITSGEFAYDGDFQDSMVYAQYDAPFLLQDNQNYFFCVTSYDVDIYLGFDTQLDYNQNIDNTSSPTVNNGQPTTVVQSDNGFSGLGFGTDLSGAIAANLIPAVELGIEEQATEEKITAYPNPAVDMLTIPFANKEGNATINIVDVTGKVISTQITNLTGVNTLQIDVTDISSGMYVFNVTYENGTTSTFNVVINK